MAGDFIDVRIDLCARYGTSFEEGFTVAHVNDIGGSEYSRLYHPYPKLRYELHYENGNRDGLAKSITNLFKRALGTFHYFRVHHYAENTTNNKTEPPTALDQEMKYIGLAGANYEFQLQTLYGTAGQVPMPRRTITKPRPGTVRVALGGAEIPATDFTVNYTTGRVIILVQPIGPITAGCEFDIPMRFEADYSGVFNNLNVQSATVALIEVLDGVI